MMFHSWRGGGGGRVSWNVLATTVITLRLSTALKMRPRPQRCGFPRFFGEGLRRASQASMMSTCYDTRTSSRAYPSVVDKDSPTE